MEESARSNRFNFRKISFTCGSFVFLILSVAILLQGAEAAQAAESAQAADADVGAFAASRATADHSAALTPGATIFRDGTLLIRKKHLDSTTALITIDLLKSNKQISATFPTGIARSRLWTRLWFSKGAAQLSRMEQLAVRKSFDSQFALRIPGATPVLSATVSTESEFANSKSVVDFLANFMPIGETLEPFDSNVNLPRGFAEQYTPRAFENRFTMICDSIGKIKTASYTEVDDTVVSKDVVVGALDSQCRGRCGAGCDQAGQWRHNQYTQECLNHDLCHNATGSQLGPCKYMFWEAAAGYLFAPDCTEKAIAIGPNIPVIIPTPPAGSTLPSPATPIPDPHPNDGSITTPASQAPVGSSPAPVLND